jgi:RecA-family ATPase
MNRPASDVEMQAFAATGLEVVVAASFAGKPVPERQWLVPGLIPARDVTDLAGDGGLGKSMIALQLCAAVVTATDWLGHIPTPGPALYISCEDEIDEIHRRLAVIVKSRGFELADLTDLHIVDLTDADRTELAAPDSKQRLALTDLFDKIAALVASLRPRVVVIDTRADVFGGDEVNRTQVRYFVRALRRLCFRHDTAVLLLSHPSVAGMATGTGQSGSTAWGNSVRSRLYLERPKADDGTEPDSNLRILTTKKANYGPADTSITLRWDAGVFKPDHSTSSTIDRIARDQTVETRFLELLRDFEKQGRHVNDKAGPYYAPKAFAAADSGSIGHRQFKTAMHRLFAAGKLRSEAFGAPSRGMRRIVEVAS